MAAVGGLKNGRFISVTGGFVPRDGLVGAYLLEEFISGCFGVCVYEIKIIIF